LTFKAANHNTALSFSHRAILAHRENSAAIHAKAPAKLKRKTQPVFQTQPASRQNTLLRKLWVISRQIKQRNNARQSLFFLRELMRFHITFLVNKTI